MISTVEDTNSYQVVHKDIHGHISRVEYEDYDQALANYNYKTALYTWVLLNQKTTSFYTRTRKCTPAVMRGDD